jgi:hypothetical protein
LSNSIEPDEPFRLGQGVLGVQAHAIGADG